jgi:dolichyl-phosphate beta-glucosyltransferase
VRQREPTTDLSVVIPAFDEARRIGASLAAIDAFLRQSGLGYEIVVVDDGSRDGTGDVVEALARASHPAVRLIRSATNRGKGASLRRGMLAAHGRWACLCDADLSAPIDRLPALLAPLRSGYDVSMGSRVVPGSPVAVSRPLHRRAMARVFNAAARATGLTTRSDTQCGFKAFTRPAARLLFGLSRIDGFCFDVEILWLAERLGLRVCEVAVPWAEAPHGHVSPLRDSAAMLRDLIRIRLYAWRGGYGISAGGARGPGS